MLREAIEAAQRSAHWYSMYYVLVLCGRVRSRCGSATCLGHSAIWT